MLFEVPSREQKVKEFSTGVITIPLRSQIKHSWSNCHLQTNDSAFQSSWLYTIYESF